MRTLAIGGFLLLLPAAVLAYDIEVIQDNGDSSNRVDITIMGDGYRDIDQTKMTDDTNDFLAEFWSYTPFGEYRGFFNVKLIKVISNENGADNGSYGAVRDTALGAYFNCYNIDRLLCVDIGAVFSVATSHTPEYDVIFVIVNDPKYGGSGGSIAVFSTNSAAGQVAIHEFGHTFGDLADEYEDPYPGYPACGADCPEPNVTTKTVREEVKWNIWIDPSTPVPTPETSTYQNVVGVFEGARYQSTGVYRERQMCMMRALGYAFGEVCAEALVKSTYYYVDPIDSATPSSPVSLNGCDSVDLQVTYPVPDPDTMLVTWKVDGVITDVGPAVLSIDAAGLGDGAHQVIAEVSDETLLVRNDPSNLLFDSIAWTVNVSGAGTGGCLIGGTCYAGGTPNPANPCQECQPAVNPTGWTNDDTNDCNDGGFCNGAESCSGGACQAGTAPCADDGLACTDTCDEGQDQCNVLQPGFCLIAGACQADGTVNPQNPCQECQAGSDPGGWSNDDTNSCEDGVFCNGAESCQAGSCTPGAPPCSDDGLACTDTCDEGSGACNVLQASFCLIAGACEAEGTPNPQNPCQECQAAVDPGAWSSDDTNSCDDGIFCNGAESCQAGSCAAGAAPCTDDGLACTTTCDESAGACNVAQPGFCVIGGACEAEGTPNPANPCQECMPGTDPEGWSNDDTNACDDSDVCTQADACVSGACTGTRIPGCCMSVADCDDGAACTEDSCDAGTCSNTLQAGFCLIGGACHPDGAENPANPCQVCGVADGPLTWTNEDGKSCDDGDACTLGDVCQAGACAGPDELCSEECPCEEDEIVIQGGCGCGGSPARNGSAIALLALAGLAFRTRTRARRPS